MKYHEYITTYRNGFHIDDSLLRPIGIYDNSNCWGIVVKSENNQKDLIISSLPYRSWGCMVRLQVRIKNDNLADNLSILLQILEEKGANIYSTQMINSGFNHVLLDLMLEFSKYRYPKFKPEKDNPGKAFEEMHKTMASIKIEAVKKKILYTAIEGRTSKFFNPKNNDSVDLKNALNKLETSSFEWNWMNSLAINVFENVSGGGRDKFTYKKNHHGNGLLKLDERDEKNIHTDFSKLLNELNQPENNSPFMAIASFNTQFNYIRIRSLANQDLVQLKINHDFRLNGSRQEDDDIASRGSIGLTHHIMESINDKIKALKIYTVSSAGLRRKNSYREEGTILISGAVSDQINFDENKKIIKRSIETKISKEFVEAKIEPFYRKLTPYKIFISYRNGFFDGNNLREELTLTLHKTGFEPIFSETQINDVTENVISNMDKCSACIQIYSLSPQERQEKLHASVIGFKWMFFEHGLATQRKIPLGRLINLSDFPKKEWNNILTIESEKFLVEFKEEFNSIDFLNKIESLAHEMRKEIRSKARGQALHLT